MGRDARAGITPLVAITSITSTLAGCLLTTSLDGFSGGEDGRVDGGVQDGGVQDGGPLPASSFCATQPSTLYLCADFDDGRFPAPFKLDLKGAGAARAVSGDVRSAPFAALLVAPVSGGSVGASLVRELPSGAQSITVELDLLVEQYGGTSDYDVLTINGGEAEIGFQLNADRTLSFDEDSAAMKNKEALLPGVALPAGWAHLKMTFVVAGPDVAAELFIDGTSRGKNTFASTATTVKEPTLEVGDTSLSDAKTEWRIRVDNVTVALR